MMALIPQKDENFLKERELKYELKQVGSEVHLILKDWPFPAAYSTRTADILMRIIPPYPLGPLDMFWTIPDVKLVSGAWPQAAEVHETYDGKSWQRWSRHYEWRAGIDSLRTFIPSITNEINLGI